MWAPFQGGQVFNTHLEQEMGVAEHAVGFHKGRGRRGHGRQRICALVVAFSLRFARVAATAKQFRREAHASRLLQREAEAVRPDRHGNGARVATEIAASVHDLRQCVVVRDVFTKRSIEGGFDQELLVSGRALKGFESVAEGVHAFSATDLQLPGAGIAGRLVGTCAALLPEESPTGQPHVEPT